MSKKTLSRRAKLWDLNHSDLPRDLRELLIDEIERQEREGEKNE